MWSEYQHKVQRLLEWDAVRPVASNDLTRIIGLIPLAGYLILFNDQIIGYASFDTIAGLSGDDESTFLISGIAKMRYVFFGSILLVLSNIVFRIHRPQVMKHSTSDLGFCSTFLESYSVSEMRALEDEVWSDPQSFTTESLIDLRDRHVQSAQEFQGRVTRFSDSQRSQLLNQQRDYLFSLAREWWSSAMKTKPFWRGLSMLVGIVGYVFLAIPTFDIMQAVFVDLCVNIRTQLFA